MDIKQFVRTVPDFPKDGVMFRDITTLLQHPPAFRYVIEALQARYKDLAIDAVVGIDARGFLLASPLAYLLGSRLVLARKAGKLPFETIRQSYQLEYNEAILEMHVDAVPNNARVLIVDDLLATGGTLSAASQLVSQYNAQVVECAVVIELPDLNGRARLDPHQVHSLVCFSGD